MANLIVQLSNDIERIQKRALKIIYQECEYGSALKKANLNTLFQYRDDGCVEHIKKMINSAHKLHNLLPARLEDFSTSLL